MNQTTTYKIAFVGWNPFQFIHIKHLAVSLPNAVFILEKRPNNNIKFFSSEILDNQDVPIVITKQCNMYMLDDLYDMIITQTPFYDIHKIKKAKIVMLQYGYAKEPHNYGAWRVFADICLTYGDYASKKISPFCPTAATGNPRFDLWHNRSFHENAKNKYLGYLNTYKKTILYLPTWGDLSSFDLYIDSIFELSPHYNILVKVHHNTDFLERERIKKLKENNIHFFGANDDSLELLSLSDVVISDYSGAIFDAIYCDKPIVLLDLPDKKLLKSKKIDSTSLEFSNRDVIGIRTFNPDDLSHNVEKALQGLSVKKAKLNSLKKELFLSTEYATQNVIECLEKFMDGYYQKNLEQEGIHKVIVKQYTKKHFLKKLYTPLSGTYHTLLSHFHFDAKEK